MRWLGRNRASETRFRLYTEQPRYRPGAPVRVYCEVKDGMYRPELYAKVHLTAMDETYVMAPLPEKRGVYYAEFYNPAETSRVLRADISKAGKVIGEARTVVRTSGQNEEAEVLALNENLLREIARLSGGRYFREDEIGDLNQVLAGADEQTVSITEQKFWDRLPFLLLLIGLLSVEWFVRRRRGLA